MGVIDNCEVDNVTITGYSYVGGITGYSYTNAVISGCSIKNSTITATHYSAGGIAGLANNGNKISGCTVENTTVTATANVGSLVGAIGGEGTTLYIEDCTAAAPLVGGNYSDNKAVIAKVGDKYYSSLVNAIDAANGATVELLADVAMEEAYTVNNGVLTIAGNYKLTLNDMLSVSGTSTINISCTLDGSINLNDGAILVDSTINGDVFVAGNVIFRGKNTVNMLYDYGNLTDYYGTTAPMKWTIEAGSSLDIVKAARYGLGYGDEVTVNGNIENALTAREELTREDASLFMHGLVAQESKGWNESSSFTVNNAYVIIGSNNSFGNKPGNYGGVYTFTFTNSVVDASRITFYEALSTTNFKFIRSDVKLGTFMTNDADSVFELNNTKLVSTTTTNGTDESNTNAGQLILVNSSLTYSAEFKNIGTVKLDTTSKIIAPKMSGAGKIVVDATGFDGNDVTVIAGDLSGFTGTIELVNCDTAEYAITEAGLVVSAKKVAKIGETYYATLQAAINAAEAGATVTLLENVNEEVSITKSITLDLNGKKVYGANSDAVAVSGGATVTIMNGILESNGNNCAGVWVKNATAIIKDCTLVGTNSDESSAVYASNGATVTIENCELSANHYALVMMGADVTINSGKLEAPISVSANGSDAYDDATLTINGGTFNGGIYWPASGKLTIKGGEFTAKTAVYVKSGSLEINGGKFTGNGEAKEYVYTLSGYEATGAAIVIENVGGDEYDAIGTVVIKGGEFISENNVCIVGIYVKNDRLYLGIFFHYLLCKSLVSTKRIFFTYEADHYLTGLDSASYVYMSYALGLVFLNIICQKGIHRKRKLLLKRTCGNGNDIVRPRCVKSNVTAIRNGTLKLISVILLFCGYHLVYRDVKLNSLKLVFNPLSFKLIFIFIRDVTVNTASAAWKSLAVGRNSVF